MRGLQFFLGLCGVALVLASCVALRGGDIANAIILPLCAVMSFVGIAVVGAYSTNGSTALRARG